MQELFKDEAVPNMLIKEIIEKLYKNELIDE